MAKIYADLFGYGAKSRPYQLHHESGGAKMRPLPNFNEAHLLAFYIFNGAQNPRASRSHGLSKLLKEIRLHEKKDLHLMLHLAMRLILSKLQDTELIF